MDIYLRCPGKLLRKYFFEHTIVAYELASE